MNRHSVKAGVCLHWAERGPQSSGMLVCETSAARADVHAHDSRLPLLRLIFVLPKENHASGRTAPPSGLTRGSIAGTGASADLSASARMFVEAGHGPLEIPTDSLAGVPAFYVAVTFSGPALQDALSGDASPGAVLLLKISRGEAAIGSLAPLSMPPMARLAVESICRCPFAAGACRALALEARCNDMLIAFLSALDAWLRDSPARVARSAEGVRLAAELIVRRLDAPPSLADLARAVGMSETTLKRAFRVAHGTTVFGFLRERRMEHARALLQSGAAPSVIEIAARVGYDNPSNFAAAFRRRFGQNPKRFQLTAGR